MELGRRREERRQIGEKRQWLGGSIEPQYKGELYGTCDEWLKSICVSKQFVFSN